MRIHSDGARCRADIDLDAIRHNASVCAELAGPECGVMAIVKADAYGHGLAEVVRALSGKVQWFGVANIDEALIARNATTQGEPILILSPCLPSEREEAVTSGFSVCISSREELEDYSSIAVRRNTTARIHIKVDTGMGRMGCLPPFYPELRELAGALPGLTLEGVCSHFPSADEDPEFTREQISEIRKVLHDREGLLFHMANSAGLISFQKEMEGSSLVRPGLALYGISPVPDPANRFRPALTLRSSISLVREIPAGTSISYGRTFISDRPMTTAILGLGYGDGFPRSLASGGAEVLISGTRCPVLGRITMDQVVVDVSHLNPKPRPGDETVLIGRQGDEEISASELAERAGTIPWEILTGITSRVVRNYVG